MVARHSYLARRMFSYSNYVSKEQHPSLHHAFSCILMVAPTESHAERSLSSSHPDRCLYAVLAFIRYAWYRVVCYSSTSTGLCISFFSIFCSYLVLSASHRRLSLLYTYTQQQTLTPAVFSSLPSVALTQGHTQESLSPEGTVSALLAFIRYVCAVSRIPGIRYICLN